MKKFGKVLVGLIILLLIAAVGCGGYYIYTQNEDHKKEVSELKQQIDDIGKKVNNTDNNKSENNVSTDDDENQQSRELSASELSNIAVFFNSREVNGFVGPQTYKSAEEIDLTKVFYDYSNGRELNDELVAEYLKTTNSEELATDLTVLTTEEVQDYYKKYTGKTISKEEVKKRLDWVYVEKFDSYCFQHGDTNHMNVVCKEGYEYSNGIYEVKVSHPDWIGDESNVTTVKMKKSGDSYIFISHI